MTQPARTAAELTRAELTDALTRSANNAAWGEEAAVRVLIAQGHWLTNAELTRHIDIDEDVQGRRTAWVDWQHVTSVPDNSPAARGEQAILRLACHLAGHLPQPLSEAWTIAEIVTDLDPTTSLLASRAVAMAALGPDAVGPLT